MNIHPILHIGVDIAYSRDSSAVSCVYRDDVASVMRLWGHHIWTPPVHIPNVTECLRFILSTERVASIVYDRAHFVGEVQRLMEEGYESILHDVNQQTMMVEIGNCLANTLQRKMFLPYSDPVRRGQYSWCNAVATERGYRIVKQKQTRQIDIVVADAMAVWSCTQDFSFMSTPSYDEEQHTVALEDMM
jgi:phage terminase large subunit-like protein